MSKRGKKRKRKKERKTNKREKEKGEKSLINHNQKAKNPQHSRILKPNHSLLSDAVQQPQLNNLILLLLQTQGTLPFLLNEMAGSLLSPPNAPWTPSASSAASLSPQRFTNFDSISGFEFFIWICFLNLIIYV